MEVAQFDQSDSLLPDVDLTRAAIIDLENQMKQCPQLEIEVKHHFSNGIYAREIFIPKGTLLTGKIHKHEHLNVISKGKIKVLTEQGAQIVEAPCTIISAPMTKRVGLALEDTVWITIHATNETDLVKLEEDFIHQSYDDAPMIENDSEVKLCHG